MCLSPYAKKGFTQLGQDIRPPLKLSDDFLGFLGFQASRRQNMPRTCFDCPKSNGMKKSINARRLRGEMGLA